MLGTSPAIVALPAGGYQVVYQTADGVLGAVSPTGEVTGLGLGAWHGSSPSLAPATSGGFQVAFQANTGMLWTRFPDATAENLGLGMPLTP